MNALALATLIAAQAIGGGSVGGGGSGSAADPVPVFDFDPGAHGSGPAQLTADAFGMTTVVLCDARTATTSNWPCDTGGTFTESEGDVVPGFGAPFTEEGGRASWYDRYYAHRAPTTSLAEVGSGVDVSMVAVVSIKARAAVQYVASKYDTANSEGWGIRVTAGDVVQGVANATTFGSYTLDSLGQWLIVEYQCDSGATNGARLYVDGKLVGSAANCPSDLTTSTVAKNFSVGCRPNGTNNDCIDGFVSYVRVQTCTGCMTSTAAQDAVAAQHALQLMGVWPSHAVTSAPTLWERTTPAYVDIVREGDHGTVAYSALQRPLARLFRVGPNWVRVGRRIESGGTGLDGTDGRAMAGVLIEGPIQDGANTNTNLLLNSHTYGSTWTDITVADYVVTNPGLRWLTEEDDEVDRYQAAADAVGVEHGLRQAVTLSASTSYIFSVYAAFSDAYPTESTAWLWLRDATIANAIAWFDVQHCQAGSYGAGLHDFGGANGNRQAGRWIHDEGSTSAAGYQWCRMSIVVDGTAASHNFDIGFSAADGATTMTTSADQRLALLGGSQIEATTSYVGFPHPTSYMPTFGSTTTRDEDHLEFAALDNWPSSGGTLLTWFLTPDARIMPGVESGSYARQNSGLPCQIEKDSSNVIQPEQTGDVGANGAGFLVTQGGSWQTAQPVVTGISNMRAGRIEWFKARVMADDVYATVGSDPSRYVSDASVTLPTMDANSTISIGYSRAFNVEWINGLVGGCRIWSGDHYADVANP